MLRGGHRRGGWGRCHWEMTGPRGSLLMGWPPAEVELAGVRSADPRLCVPGKDTEVGCSFLLQGTQKVLTKCLLNE